MVYVLHYLNTSLTALLKLHLNSLLLEYDKLDKGDV